MQIVGLGEDCSASGMSRVAARKVVQAPLR